MGKHEVWWLGPVLAASLIAGGCSCVDGTPEQVGGVAISESSPDPFAPAPAPTDSAAEQALAAFVAAAEAFDAEIAEAGLLVNGLFVPEGVRFMETVSGAVHETQLRVSTAADLIPAGLEEDLRVAAVQVYQDLQHRAHSLAYTTFHIGSGLAAIEQGDFSAARDASELADQAREMLSYGGMSKARFAADLAALEQLAADSTLPSVPVRPDSDAAGLLAYEVARLEIGMLGCHAPPAPPIPVTAQQQAWEAVEIGPIESGVTVTQAEYDPIHGWQIVFPYC